MTKPFVQEIQVQVRAGQSMRLTSVVLDESEFDTLVVEVAQAIGVAQEIIENLRQAQHIPLILRSSNTEIFFRRYGVHTERMSVIVRGRGTAILQAMADRRLKH